MAKSDDDWEFVEVKTDDTPLTEAQEEFKEECEKEGKTYVVKRMRSVWY